MVESTASQLFNTYWHEGIDRPLVAKPKGSGKFHTQVSRPAPGTQADTPPPLGPGEM